MLAVDQTTDWSHYLEGEPPRKCFATHLRERDQRQSQYSQDQQDHPQTPGPVFQQHLVVPWRQLDSDKTGHQHNGVRRYPIYGGSPVWMISDFQHQQAIAIHADVSRKGITADFLGKDCASRWACGDFYLRDHPWSGRKGINRSFLLEALPINTVGCCLTPGNPLASHLDAAG